MLPPGSQPPVVARRSVPAAGSSSTQSDNVAEAVVDVPSV